MFDPHTLDNASKLERVQERAAKFVKNYYNRDSSVTSILNSLQWTPLDERRASTKICIMYKAQDSKPTDLGIIHRHI